MKPQKMLTHENTSQLGKNTDRNKIFSRHTEWKQNYVTETTVPQKLPWLPPIYNVPFNKAFSWFELL